MKVTNNQAGMGVVVVWVGVEGRKEGRTEGRRDRGVEWAEAERWT